jgi:hypothetical protein
MANRIEKYQDLINYLEPDEKKELLEIMKKATPQKWVPMVGPQLAARESQADIIFFGGAAGGGKSDLLLGLALDDHINSIIFRRQSTQLLGIQDRLLDEILKSRKGWNGQTDVLRLPGRKIEFGSCNNAGDEKKYQGRPHDLAGFDEITHFLEAQFRFLIGWLRTVKKGQRTRIVCTGNPPTDSDGRWILDFWGPWINSLHPNPAMIGELRWFATIDGKHDVEVENGEPFDHKGERIQPLSRTFIPSHIEDNPFLMATGYKSQLQALPEPLRSQMLKGDFMAGVSDDEWQVIPTAWVEAAQARWKPDGKKGKQMDSVGVDVARGGADKTMIAPRYGNWFDELKVHPGQTTPDGPTVAGLVVKETKDSAPIHIDITGGFGGSPYDHLNENSFQVIGINNAATDFSENQVDRDTNKIKFKNNRAFFMWRFREALEPGKGDDLALPPDPELKADLCAPRYKLTPQGYQVEQKDEIKKRIKRSPDKGDAVILANIRTVKNSPRRQKNWRARMPETTWRSV